MRISLTKIFSRIIKSTAHSYIAGPEIEDAVRICRQIGRDDWRSTICPWDGPNETPRSVASNYQQALHAIREENLDCYLSIKLPSLKYDFGLLKELLEIASENNTRIHFDALAPETADSSFALLEKALLFYSNLGCTLPSRWKRSISDARRAIELGVAVRIVKGQWRDPDAPNMDPVVHFLKLIDMLAGSHKQVSVASHDIDLAKESLFRLKKSGTSCELEQLYGFPFRVDRVAKPLGVNVRIYIPYGYAYLPYVLSEVKKRPIVLGWLIKDIFSKKNNFKSFS